MKPLLYATFALLAMTELAHAVEVVDLTTPETTVAPAVEEVQEARSYTWFWQRKEPKEKANTKESKPELTTSAPVARNITNPQMALLLPLTGQYNVAAQAIRDGFISAYYLEKADSLSGQTDIRIYDTHADKEVINAYQQAKSEGADIIVGPLTKPGLETLLDNKAVDSNTIVIALNTLEGRTRLPHYLYPFSLGPEDEAYRLAEFAIQNGHQFAAGLVEQDAFGRRAAASFKRRFEQLGGKVVDITYFDTNRPLEDPVHYVLKVRETKDANGETSIVGSRQDLDFLFLVAKPEQARQIPPLMKFYYAQGLPIYAMSSVYSGTPNPGVDQDLNGIVFCDSPWVVNPHSRNATLEGMAKQLLTQEASQGRLFAFGVDAYSVAKNINRLSANPNFNFHGATGIISVDNSGFVVRQGDCARFNAGVPRVL